MTVTLPRGSNPRLVHLAQANHNLPKRLGGLSRRSFYLLAQTKLRRERSRCHVISVRPIGCVRRGSLRRSRQIREAAEENHREG
ncbi:hypothetical protein NDU88_005376 [Pleurodeles waltl]|uniref:Uncharacterized protein n=1 Tax=Pleurodeles waltl TaxID=8319 RepID=A0AAV7L9A7_PLEWA|nr:hypothetical protein NDU88_005376 [Pleurodeles waltl]